MFNLSSFSGADYLQNCSSDAVPRESAPAFYTEFAKFLQQQQRQRSSLLPSPSPEPSVSDWPVQRTDGGSLLLTKPCSVKLVNLDLKVRSVSPAMEVANIAKEAASKRDMEPAEGGPSLKKSKTDEVIIIDGDRDVEKCRPAPSSPEITVIKLNSGKSGPKENMGGSVADRKNDVKSPVESRASRTTTPDKMSPLKPLSTESGKKQGESLSSKPSPKNNGSNGGVSGLVASGGAGGLIAQSTAMDRTDRTSLQCLEQKLKDLQQKHQQKAKRNDNHAKPKSMSPSSGLKSTKDSFHRRSEAFIVERKKPLSSPVKKTMKKPSVTPPPHRENKLGGLFCPTTDAKVTILPCKPSSRDSEVKPLPSGSNSVTITKLSSGDTLSVPSKDIKKVFSKTDLKNKVISAMAVKSEKFSLKSLTKVEKLGEKGHKEHHRQHGANSREVSRDGREKGTERRERVGSLKIIRCSKCREVFSTKEAKKLHTCNSILDAHYLIDGGDRQKTSPTSSVSNSDRSESTSASLSRSSSRSSSPGLPLSNNAKRSMMTPTDGGPSRYKLAAKKLDDDRESSRGKLSKSPDDDDGAVEEDDGAEDKSMGFPALVKRDSMKEKWVETKDIDVSESQDKFYSKTDPFKKRSTGALIIEAVTGAAGPDGDVGFKPVKSSGIEIVKMERDSSRKESKDDLSSDAALFAFSGKRTYSPSMSDNTTEGKGMFLSFFLLCTFCYTEEKRLSLLFANLIPMYA